VTNGQLPMLALAMRAGTRPRLPVDLEAGMAVAFIRIMVTVGNQHEVNAGLTPRVSRASTIPAAMQPIPLARGIVGILAL